MLYPLARKVASKSIIKENLCATWSYSAGSVYIRIAGQSDQSSASLGEVESSIRVAGQEGGLRQVECILKLEQAEFAVMTCQLYQFWHQMCSADAVGSH